VPDASQAVNATQALRWNGESGRYWVANRERRLAEHQNLTPRLFEAAAISPGEIVLDVGCGCGATTIAAARAAGRAIGVDISEVMLATARHLADQSGVPDVAFVRGDAQVCPLRDDSCDVMISSFGVLFFEDPAAAFAAMARAIRPDGRTAFLCWQPGSDNELFGIHLHAFEQFVDLPEPQAGGLFFDPAQIAELLDGTGWRDVQVQPLTAPAWMGADVSDVMAYVAGMPTTQALRANITDDVVTERILATLAREYGRRERPDGVWVQAAAWLVTARRGSLRSG
jgi:ubiquinone/menaquinone biosynthesis C-methylase UbiE